MTPAEIELLFGRGRLKMHTGEHVEVVREPAAPGEKRRYTKRFLRTDLGDFRLWTEREWRILARLLGHGVRCIPEMVVFDRSRDGNGPFIQTYDAGITVEQWATLIPVERDGRAFRHVFDDCAHWWALAHHCLQALHEIHRIDVVHLDLKADNVCLPLEPFDVAAGVQGQGFRAMFGDLALIDFAFSLVSGEPLPAPLPLAWQRDCPYQSPRLIRALSAARRGDLKPAQALDWRCDLFSLATLLNRFLPAVGNGRHPDRSTGWTPHRYRRALRLLELMREAHDEAPLRPHRKLLEFSGRQLLDREFARSLATGWQLTPDAGMVSEGARTPLTRIATASPDGDSGPTPATAGDGTRPTSVPPRSRTHRGTAVFTAAC